jgi:solute carrier family 35 (UDP-sugar transporter), member A1/2/3
MQILSQFNLLLLLALVVIENSNVLLTRYTRSGVSGLFNIADMMVVTELCKVILAIALEYRSTGENLGRSLKQYFQLFSIESLKVALPAFLYFVQNSLFYVALTNLSSPVFQVLYQMKLLTTALVSVFILQRRYLVPQWISLCTLTIGAAIAVMAKESGTETVTEELKSKIFVGIAAVITACFCSAFAGVWFEKLLKKEPKTDLDELNPTPAYLQTPSLWMRNIQLGTFSFLFAIIQVAITNFNSRNNQNTARLPFLSNFSYMVWMLVLLRATAGILVAVIIKQMDNVVKSITSSVSVLAGCVLSQFIFGTALQPSFWFGAVIVVFSSYIFSQPSTKITSFIFSISSYQPISTRTKKPIFTKGVVIIITCTMTVGFLIGAQFFLPEDSRLRLIRAIPTEGATSTSDGVPINYRDHLHFVVAVVGGFNPKGDCGGCNVLWELHHTLAARNYSTATSFQNIPPNSTVVVIYPEVQAFNYSSIGHIHVRWILAPIGVKVRKSVTDSWGFENLIFNYATSTGKNIPVSNVLQVVNTPAKGDETDISDEEFRSPNRSGIGWMMRKGPDFHPNIIPIHNRPGYNVTKLDGIVTITGLRKYEFFVTYDPYTYWTWFAAMQGTVSIVYPLPNVTKTEWALGTFLGSYMQDQDIKEIPGVAYGWEDREIEYAKRTMHLVRPFLVSLRKWGAEITVPRFARDCYRYSIGERHRFESGMLKKDVYPFPNV